MPETDNPAVKTRLTDRKRAQILDAAVSQFQERGYANTSMDLVATVANVSKRTVYNHFSSKDVLFAAIVTQLLERCRNLDLPTSDEQSIREQLYQIALQYGQLVVSDEFMKLSRVVLSRFLQNPEQASTMVHGQGDTQVAIAGWMAQAKKAGRLAIDDPERAAVQLTAQINAFALWPQLIGNQAPPDTQRLQEIVNEAVDIFMAYHDSKS